MSIEFRLIYFQLPCSVCVSSSFGWSEVRKSWTESNMIITGGFSRSRNRRNKFFIWIWKSDVKSHTLLTMKRKYFERTFCQHTTKDSLKLTFGSNICDFWFRMVIGNANKNFIDIRGKFVGQRGKINLG